MPVLLGSAGIWSPLEIRHASIAVAAEARSPAAVPFSSLRPAAAATSPLGGVEWAGRGAQLQASVATQRAMQRREEERDRGSNPTAGSAAALAARVAAQAASAAPTAPLSWMTPVPASLPSSLPLGEYGSFISPVKLSRRDQLILSTFEWGHRPQPAYMPLPITSPQSAPSKAEHGDAAARSQQRSGSRTASRAADADRSQLHRSRSTGSGAARQRSTPASTSFAPAVSPLSYRTGDVSSLVGITPLDKTHVARNARSDPALLLSDYSDPLLSSPHAPLPLGWATGPRDTYLDSLAHIKMKMQMEAAAGVARNNALTPYSQQQRPIDSSSRSGLSSEISAALSGDLSPLPHSSLRNDRSSSSDASRWQQSSDRDQSDLLLLTHLSDSPAEYS